VISAPTSAHWSRSAITIGEIKINPTTLSLDTQSESIKCTKSEFELLYFLAKHQWEIVARDTLMREIMGYDNYLYDRTIDTHMKNLRKKVDLYMMIETVRGVGYILRGVVV
jgi:DNA-binding response OmpR family regulator